MSQPPDQPAERSADPAQPATPEPGRREPSATDNGRRAATVPVGLVKATLLQIYDELFAHDGYATLKVEMRILRRSQKEVILDAGKQFRFVVEYPQQEPPPGST